MEQVWVRGYEWAASLQCMPDSFAQEHIMEVEDYYDRVLANGPLWKMVSKQCFNGIPYRTSRGYAWGWYKDEPTFAEMIEANKNV